MNCQAEKTANTDNFEPLKDKHFTRKLSVKILACRACTSLELFGILLLVTYTLAQISGMI